MTLAFPKNISLNYYLTCHSDLRFRIPSENCISNQGPRFHSSDLGDIYNLIVKK